MAMRPRDLKHLNPGEEGDECRVDVPEAPNHYSLIQTFFSLPPYLPELRVDIIGSKRKRSNRWPQGIHYIFRTRRGIKLTVATLRKAADMIEAYADRLPDDED